MPFAMYHFNISHSNSFNPVAQIVCQMHQYHFIPLHYRQVKVLFDFGDNGNYSLETGFVAIWKNSVVFYKNFCLARLGTGHQNFLFLNEIISVLFIICGIILFMTNFRCSIRLSESSM